MGVELYTDDYCVLEGNLLLQSSALTRLRHPSISFFSVNHRLGLCLSGQMVES